MSKIRCRAIIIEDSKIFLTVPSLAKEPFYCLPGWKLDEGERLEECIKREVFEELWVNAVVWDMIYVNEFINYTWELNIDFWYLIENIEDFKNLDLSKTSHWKLEILEYWFYDLSKLNKPLKPEFLPEILKELNSEKKLSKQKRL